MFFSFFSEKKKKKKKVCLIFIFFKPGPSWAEHGTQVAQAYFGFSAIGVKRGDRVVLLGDAEGGTRVAYLAIQCAGAIPVCM